MTMLDRVFTEMSEHRIMPSPRTYESILSASLKRLAVVDTFENGV
jgi:hypothetical protein